MAEESVWIETLLNNDLNKKTVSRVLDVQMVSAVPEGNNYASVIYRATLNVINKNGDKSKITLIIKKEHESKGKVKVLEDFSMFKCEIMFYSQILSKYEQVINEYQDCNDKLWGTMFGFRPYNCIVFEDLKATNFKMANRKTFLDKNHALLVMTSLGRFHAIGYKLIKQGLVCKNDFYPYYMETDSPVIKKFFSTAFQQLCNVIENDWPSEWKDIGQKLYKQKDVAEEKVKNLFVNKPDDCFETICHGDCWTCNMLFKYCPYDEEVPVAVKFLDFQTTHMNSYGFDIIYFLFESVQPDIRRQYIDEFLTVYHNSLKETAKFYDIDENQIPSMEHLKKEMKRLEYYALIINLLYLPVTSADVNEAFTMEKFDPDYEGTDAYNPEIFRSDKYKNAVQSEMKKWLNDKLY